MRPPQERVNPLPFRVGPLEELVNVLEVEEIARRRLDGAVYDHIASGVGGGYTVRRNREAFDRIIFRPRVLVNVTKMDLSTELLGQKLYAPVLVAPTARHARLHPEGERATAQGASAAHTVMVISQDSSAPVEQIVKQTAAVPPWFQVWAQSDAARLRETVARAVAAGCKAVCLTVGAPFRTLHDSDLHYRLGTRGPRYPDLEARADLNPRWDLVGQLREWSKVPVLVKGILSAGEARTAVAAGASGLIVSNHGGRAVDGVPATIEALPQIAEAAGAATPVLVDGGFRRGTDILKALALGAKAVLVGRPVLWGLAAYGAEGVRAVLFMLHNELAQAMGLCGKPNLAAIDRTVVKLLRR